MEKIWLSMLVPMAVFLIVVGISTLVNRWIRNDED